MKFFSCVLLLGVLTMFGGRPVSSNLDVDHRKKFFKKFKLKSPLEVAKNIGGKVKENSEKVKEGFASVAEDLNDLGNGLKDGVKGKIADINDDLKGLLGGAFESFKKASKNVRSGMALLKGGLLNAVENTRDNWKLLIKAGKTVRTAVEDFAKKNAKDLKDAVKTDSINVLKSFQEKLQNCLQTLKDLATAIKTLVSKLVEEVKKAASATAQAIAKAIAKVAEPFVKVAKLMKTWLSDEDNMKTALKLIEPQLKKLVGGVVDKLEEKGVTDYFPELADLIEEQTSIDNLASKMSAKLDDATADIQSEDEE